MKRESNLGALMSGLHAVVLCLHLRQRHCVLQGELEITTEAGTGKAAQPNAQGKVTDLVERVPFLMLALDLPPAPLYKDALEKNIIPQVYAQRSFHVLCDFHMNVSVWRVIQWQHLLYLKLLLS